MEEKDNVCLKNSKESEIENQKLNSFLEYFKKDLNGRYHCEFCVNKFVNIHLIHDHYFEEHLNLLTSKYFGKKLKEGHYCFICKVIINEPTIKVHCNVQEHKIKAGLVKTNKITISIKDSLKNENFKKDEYGHYCCATCQNIYIHKRDLGLHFQSPKHLSFVKKVKELNLNIEELKSLRNTLLKLKKVQETSQIFCVPCKKIYKEQKYLNRHFKESTKHKSNVENYIKIIKEKETLDLNDKNNDKNIHLIDDKNNDENINSIDLIDDEHILNDPKLEKTCKFCKTAFKNIKKHLNSFAHQEKLKTINTVTRTAKFKLISKTELKCKLCNKTCSSKKTYLSHLNSKFHRVMSRESNKGAENKKEIKKLPEYHCKTCNFTYFSRISYSTHIFSHSNGKHTAPKELIGDKCKYCDRRFREKKNLYYHINFHDGVPNKNRNKRKEVVCYICGMNVTSLNTHMMQTHQFDSRIEVKCKICKEMFESNESLLNHLKSVHNTSKNQVQVECPKCGSKISKPNLFSHIRETHYNIRRFKCKACGKKFKNKCHLNNHFLCHTGEKPFSCDICLQAFREKGALKKHLVIHTGERFSCDLCKKTFTQKWCVRFHKKKNHPESV